MKQTRLLILFSIILLFNISFICAFNSNNLSNTMCYQETANASNSNDGSCGLNYTGNYNTFPLFSLWNNPEQIYDGSHAVNNRAWASSPNTGNVVINYSFPNNTKNNSVWTVWVSPTSGGTPTNYNYSIPNSCWNQSIISFQISSIGATGGLFGYCFDGSGYNTNIFTNLIGENLGAISEEAMIWNVQLLNENLTFSGNQNITRYLSIPSNVFLTNGFLNLSGYNYNNTCYQETANISSYCGGLNSGVYSSTFNSTDFTDPEYQWYDGDHNTYTGYNKNVFKYFLVNYTIPSKATNLSKIRVDYGYPANRKDDYYTIPNSCFNYGKIAVRLGVSRSPDLCMYECMNSTGWTDLTGSGLVTCGNGGSFVLYEEAMYWDINDYPNNVSIYIGANSALNYFGNFTTINNRTNNLANYINSYLSSCTYIGGYCFVPFNFHSDTSGILMYSDLIFSNEGFTENNQIYSLNTYETANEQFSINITYDPNYYQVSTANLMYNNTNYASTKLTVGLNTIFTSNVDIPLVAVDKTNNTFYWSISLTNTTGTFVFNTSLINQTINQIYLGNCGGTNTSLALNITNYNEKTLERINPFSIAGTINYSIGRSPSSKVYSFGNTTIDEKDICINVNTTYTLNGLLTYSNQSFQTSTYYFLNYNVSNSTKQFALYSLPTASSTSFILQVQDQNILPLSGYTIKINRYYPAYDTYQTVQVVRTDENGQSIAFLETETVDYQFLIYDQDGNLVYTSDTRKIIPQSTPYTITFTVGSLLPSPLSYLENLTGLTYSLTYDKTTMKVTYSYADSNSSFTSSRLIVSNINMSGSNLVLCNSTLSTPSGVIVCDLTGNLSGTYSATAYITRDSTNFIDNIVFEINTFADTSGMLGVMGGFFLLLICAFLFPYNHVASILILDVGIIFLNIMSFVSFGPVAITAIIAISILILIIFERD